jgi:lipopolysaccharide heptosyltransferase II
MSALEILVRGPNWTGDLVMATPGFRALRAGFPEARITLHVRAALAPLVAGAPWLDAVVPLAEPASGARAVLREARALRARGRFDLGLCLPDSFASALLMRAAGVRRVVGYAKNGRSALLSQRVALPRAAGRRGLIARELHVLGLVEALGCRPLGTGLELFVTESEQREADAALAAAGASPGEPLALLAPGASFGPSKLWPAASFAAVGDALAHAGARVVVTGSGAERELCARVCGAMQRPALDLCGALGLGPWKGLMRRARLLVANDAGARHVAVALGLPVVLVMGPTSLEKTSCNLERVSVLSADVACRPCYLRDCPIDHRCMTQVGPESVADEAVRAFAAPARFAGVQRRVGRMAA